jgi:hypothetical protein
LGFGRLVALKLKKILQPPYFPQITLPLP